MNSELRKLIVSKRNDAGIALEELVEATKCTLAELRGFEQGLFILGLEKLCSLISALRISHEELIEAVGEELAASLTTDCSS